MRWGCGGEIDFVTGEVCADPAGGSCQPAGTHRRRQHAGPRSETLQEDPGHRHLSKLFDLAVASTGLNEKRLVQLGLPFERGLCPHLEQPRRLLSWRPPGQPQAACLPRMARFMAPRPIGSDGIDKRIDVLAVAPAVPGSPCLILRDLELTHAPPFGSAKDVINMAGFVASNHLK